MANKSIANLDEWIGNNPLEETPDFWNSDWSALFPALGMGLQGIGAVADWSQGLEDIKAGREDIDLGFKRTMNSLNRQEGDLGSAMTQGMADATASMANAGMGGVSADVSKAGAENRFSRAMADLADEKQYQATMKDRQLARLDRAEGANNLNLGLRALGMGLGAVGSVAENNWFGLADSKSKNRGRFFARMG